MKIVEDGKKGLDSIPFIRRTIEALPPPFMEVEKRALEDEFSLQNGHFRLP